MKYWPRLRALSKQLLVVTILIVVVACINLVTGSKKSDSEVLDEVKVNLSSLATIVQPVSMNLWWVSRDGYSIINDFSPGIEAQLAGCVTDTSGQPMLRDFAMKTSAAVDKVMIAEGFAVEAETNSSSNVNDAKFYDYVRAYYRGETKAVLSISPDCASTSPEADPAMYYSATFGYTTDYQENYEAQSPFLYDLELKDSIVHIQKSEGEFRVLNVNLRRTGYAMIVKTIDGKWTKLWAGQDVISCDIRDKNQIPLSIAPDCY
jgi:hypothetical protein